MRTLLLSLLVVLLVSSHAFAGNGFTWLRRSRPAVVEQNVRKDCGAANVASDVLERLRLNIRQCKASATLLEDLQVGEDWNVIVTCPGKQTATYQARMLKYMDDGYGTPPQCSLHGLKPKI